MMFMCAAKHDLWDIQIDHIDRLIMGYWTTDGLSGNTRNDGELKNFQILIMIDDQLLIVIKKNICIESMYTIWEEKSCS